MSDVSAKLFYVCALLFISLIAISVYFNGPLLAPPPGYIEGQIWFAPNKGSLDYTQLFLNESAWFTVLRNVDVFEFHPEVLLNGFPNPCNNPSWPWCENSSYQNLVAIDTFRKLETMGMELSTGAPAVKVWGCEAVATVPLAEQMIQNVLNAGATIDYITMDQPYIGGEAVFSGQSCGFTMEQSAQQTSIYISTLKANHPNLKIGDTEPYPYFSPQQIIAWADELESLGTPLDYFQLDVAYGLPDIDLSGMSEIKDYFESKGIPYSVIYWANTDFPDGHGSTTQWYNDAITWAQTVKNNNYDGPNQNFHSWEYANPLPVTLPETLSGQTMTNMVLNSLPFLLDDDATFVNQVVPTDMTAGQTYTVSVTMLNSGEEVWSGKKIYGLGSQGPQDNGIWGLGRVTLALGEKIYPGEQKTFTFDVVAPTTSGNYNFEWRMIHENIEWFGANSQPITISVSDPPIVPHINSISPISILNNANHTITLTGTGLSQNFILIFAPASNPLSVSVYCDFTNPNNGGANCQWINDTEFRFDVLSGTPEGQVILGYVNFEGLQVSNPSEVFTIQSGECLESSTQSCGNNVGVCTGAIQTCTSSGTWGACNFGPTYESSETLCSDGLDNDCNGVVDSCAPVQSGGGSSGGGGGGGGSGSSGSRLPVVNVQCSDGLDNDNDGFIDYPEDTGCTSKNGVSELDALPPTTNVNTNEESGQELSGNNEDINVNLVFWTVLFSLIGGIVFTLLQIIKIIRVNSKSLN